MGFSTFWMKLPCWTLESAWTQGRLCAQARLTSGIISAHLDQSCTGGKRHLRSPCQCSAGTVSLPEKGKKSAAWEQVKCPGSVECQCPSRGSCARRKRWWESQGSHLSREENHRMFFSSGLFESIRGVGCCHRSCWNDFVLFLINWIPS